MTTAYDLRALADALTERSRQDRKWGEQNHDNFVWSAILTEEVGEAAQAALQTAYEGQRKTDADVRDEVTQCAAVALSWLGSIARRTPAHERPERIYISGPIAGNPTAEGAFARAEHHLAREAGCEPVNPWKVHALDHDGGGCPDRGYPPGADAAGHTSSCCFMRTDLLALLTCDAIYLLPGWETSRGVAVELAVAKACGLRVEHAADNATEEATA